MSTDSVRKRVFLWRNKHTFHSGYERTSPTPQTLPARDPICPALLDPAHIRAHRIVMARNEILRTNPAKSFSYMSSDSAAEPAKVPKMWTSRQAYSCEACNPSIRTLEGESRIPKARHTPRRSPKTKVSSEQIAAMSDDELERLIRKQSIEVAKLAGNTPPPSPQLLNASVERVNTATATSTTNENAAPRVGAEGQSKEPKINLQQGSSPRLPSSPSTMSLTAPDPTPKATPARVAPDTIKQQPQSSQSFQPPLMPSTNYMTASVTSNSSSSTVVNLRRQLSMSLSREMVLRDRLARAGMFNRELLLDAAAAVNERLEQTYSPPSDQLELVLVPDGTESQGGGGRSYSAVPSSSVQAAHLKHNNSVMRDSQPQDKVSKMVEWADELDQEARQLLGGPRVYDTLADPYGFHLQRSQYSRGLRKQQQIEREERELVGRVRDEIAYRNKVRSEGEYLSLVHQIERLIAEVRSPRIRRLTSPSRRLDEQALLVAAAQKNEKTLTSGELLRNTLRLSSPSSSRLRRGDGSPALRLRHSRIQAPFFKMTIDGKIEIQQQHHTLSRK